MRKIMWIVMVLAMVAAASAAGAVGKMTVDPNAPGAKAVASVPDTDARLAQKITYEAKRKTVSAILSDLSTMTGVKFRAGLNEKDWQVRDRKMNIFAKDTPLADLMSSIARMMKFKWSINRDTEPWTYRLFMDRKTLLDAETQALRQDEKIEKQLAEKREKTLSDYGKLDNLSSQDSQKLKDEDPYMYFAKEAGIASPLYKFFSNMPVLVEALATGQQVSLNSGNLSPTAQQSLLQFMQACGAAAYKLKIKGPVSINGFADSVDNVTIYINKNKEFVDATPLRGMLLGEICLRSGDSSPYKPGYISIGIGIGKDSLDLPLFDPNSKAAGVIGKALIQCIEEDKPFDDIGKNSEGDIQAALMTDFRQDDSGEPISERPNAPALEAKIKIKPQTPKLEDVESALADASGFSVVSDSFGTSIMDLVSFGSKEIALKDALEKIADGFHYNWDKRSRVLEFRDRNWFRKRNAQIPQAWIDAWKDTLKQTGTLDIGDLAQIAVLTLEQFNVNIMDDEVLMRSGLGGIFYTNRDWLEAYALLTDSQRAMVFTLAGLDLGVLSPDQWSQFGELIAFRNPAYLENTDTHMVLVGSKTSKDGRFEYTLSMTASGDLPPTKWVLTTPKYEPPKETKPAGNGNSIGDTKKTTDR